MSKNNTGERKRFRHTLRTARHLIEGFVSAFLIILFVIHFRGIIYNQEWLIFWIAGLSVLLFIVWFLVESSLVEELIDLAD